MKPRHAWVFVLALVAGAALLTASAAASAAAMLRDGEIAVPQLPPGPPPPPPPPGFAGPGGLDRLVWDLDLTEAQAQQLQALRDAARTASRPYEEQVWKAEEGIRAAIESGSFDEDAVRTLAAAESKAAMELRVIQARTDAGIMRLLTAEQRSALADLRPSARRGRRGPGGPFDPW